MRFYKDKSNPLEGVSLTNMENNYIYITDTGERVMYKEDSSGGTELLIIQQSELNIGEYVDTLTPKQLKLYWILMENKKGGKVG